MKKKFVALPAHIYEESKFIDKCKGNFSKCKKCPVLLKSDRYLGKTFFKQVGANNSTRPYTILVNTAGCNLNCWFCYAFDIIKKKDYDQCEIFILSPEELADFFECKIRCSNKIKRKDRYFSKIRITGGEPLYSNEDTLIDYQSNFNEDTVDFFLNFFESLDKKIGKLIEEKIIFLSEPKKYSKDTPFPTWLSISTNKIDVRFDTNGILFADMKIARRFIEGIFKLFKENKLKNIRIQLDYSIKGPTSVEFHWSQYNHLPINDTDLINFDIKTHPQFNGLKNIFELIEEFNKEDSNFKDFFDITIEKGIENLNAIFINTSAGFKWDIFEKKISEELGRSIKFSYVDNKFECSGPGGYFFGRYHKKRKVAIKLISQSINFEFLPADENSKEKELVRIYQTIKNTGKNYKLIFYPVLKPDD